MILQIVYLLSNGIFSFITLLTGLRIVLKLFSASSVAPFVAWLYQTTDPFVAPFAGIFPTFQLMPGFVIELSSVFAVVVYTIIGYFLGNLISGFMEQAAKKHKKHHEE